MSWKELLLWSVAAINADAHASLAEEYGIRGFPTIKVFTPGNPQVDYQGARDVEPIAEFALQQSLMSRFSVQAFPTILVFGADEDSPITYEGARAASAIEPFALEQLEINIGPAEVTQLTALQL